MKNERGCGKVIYMGDVQGSEKLDDTCVKTMHVGMMGRGFTVVTSTFM
jgi:riboflavin synthase